MYKTFVAGKTFKIRMRLPYPNYLERPGSYIEFKVVKDMCQNKTNSSVARCKDSLEAVNLFNDGSNNKTKCFRIF